MLASQKICLLQSGVECLARGCSTFDSNCTGAGTSSLGFTDQHCIGFDHACVLISDTLSEAYPPIPGSTVEPLAAIGKSSNVRSVFVRGPHLCAVPACLQFHPKLNIKQLSGLARDSPAASWQILAALHVQTRFTHTLRARTALTNTLALLAEQTLGDDAYPAVIACACYQIALICIPKRDQSTTLNPCTVKQAQTPLHLLVQHL